MLTNIWKLEHYLYYFRVAVDQEGACSIKNIIAKNSPAAENLENITATNWTDAKGNTQENDSGKTISEQVLHQLNICK